MKEGQSDHYYITGDIAAAVDHIDDFAVQQHKEFDGKNSNSVTNAGFDVEDAGEFEPLTKLIKKVLGDKVKEVVVSFRLADSWGAS